MAIAPAACIHYPVRTRALLDTVEFDEAAETAADARASVGQDMAWAVFLGDALSDDVREDVEDYAARASPPFSIHDWPTLLDCTHVSWMEAGEDIWDMTSAMAEIRVLAAQAHAFQVDDVLAPTTTAYVHFGPDGPPSPWPDCVIEGCYLTAGLCDDGVIATFVTSAPPSIPLGEAPLALSLACHVRSCNVTLLVEGTFAQSIREGMSEVLTEHPEWAPFVAGAVTTLGACLSYACRPDHEVADDFSLAAPRELVAQTEFGSEADSEDAWETLHDQGFLSMRIFGHRPPAPELDGDFDAPGPSHGPRPG